MEKLPLQNLNWNTSKKIAFQFIFIYFTLFIILENNGAYPFWRQTINQLLEKPLHTIIPWIGKYVLHLPYEITVFTNGSGDTTYDYVLVFTMAVAALIGTIVWSVVDRERPNYKTLYYWLTTAVRFYVGLMLVHYGLVKVIKLQFPSPGLYRVSEPIGDLSPMGLAWTFLGFSDGYNFFMGVAEIAALLLLFRRTMTMGAIITLMAASNIMAVNYFYDVPVKIISTTLVIMTLFLLLNDAIRLLKFFFTGQHVSLPVMESPTFKKRWMNLSKLSLKFLVIGYAVIYDAIDNWGIKSQWEYNPSKSKLYGLYEVDKFIVNNDTLSKSLTDSPWNQLIIEDSDYMRVRYRGDSIAGFFTTVDTTRHKIDFKYRFDTTIKCSLYYEFSTSDNFDLSGTIKNDSVFISTKRKITDIENYRLLKRGFHWINEYPYNR